jgi:hypothetical protein
MGPERRPEYSDYNVKRNHNKRADAGNILSTVRPG